MKQLNFTIHINAPREKVWKVLWDDASYRKWTAVFSEGSYAVTDWQEGSKVLFLSPSGEGMFSRIAKSVPNQLMSFEHLGTVKDGVEQPATDETKGWEGAMENYQLEDKNGGTQLTLTMDMMEAHENYFKEHFPKALETVKSLAESTQKDNS